MAAKKTIISISLRILIICKNGSLDGRIRLALSSFNCFGYIALEYTSNNSKLYKTIICHTLSIRPVTLLTLPIVPLGSGDKELHCVETQFSNFWRPHANLSSISLFSIMHEPNTL